MKDDIQLTLKVLYTTEEEGEMVAKYDEKHVVEPGNLKNLRNQGDIENKIHFFKVEPK
jgi:hypothetical protein